MHGCGSAGELVTDVETPLQVGTKSPPLVYCLSLGFPLPFALCFAAFRLCAHRLSRCASHRLSLALPPPFACASTAFPCEDCAFPPWVLPMFKDPAFCSHRLSRALPLPALQEVAEVVNQIVMVQTKPAGAPWPPDADGGDGTCRVPKKDPRSAMSPGPFF